MKMIQKKGAGWRSVLISAATIALFAFVVMATPSSSVAQGLKSATSGTTQMKSDSQKPDDSQTTSTPQVTTVTQNKPVPQNKPVTQETAVPQNKPVPQKTEDPQKKPAPTPKKSETEQKLLALLQKILKPAEANVPKEAEANVPIEAEAPQSLDDMFKEFDAIKKATANPTEQEKQLFAIGTALYNLMVKGKSLSFYSNTILDGHLEDQFVAIENNGKKFTNEKEFGKSLLIFIKEYDFTPHKKEDMVKAVKSRNKAVVSLGNIFKTKGLITIKNTGKDTIVFSKVNLIKYDRTAKDTISLAAGQTWYFTKPLVIYDTVGVQSDPYELQDGHAYNFQITFLGTLACSGYDNVILDPIDADTLKKAIAEQEATVAAAIKKEEEDQKLKEEQRKKEIAELAQAQKAEQGTQDDKKPTGPDDKQERKGPSNIPDAQDGTPTNADIKIIPDLFPETFYEEEFKKLKYECTIDGEKKEIKIVSYTNSSEDTFTELFKDNDKSTNPPSHMEWIKVWWVGFPEKEKEYCFLNNPAVSEKGLSRVIQVFNAYDQIINDGKQNIDSLGKKSRFVQEAVVRKYLLAEYWTKNRDNIANNLNKIDQDNKALNEKHFEDIDAIINQMKKSKSEDEKVLLAAYKKIANSDKQTKPSEPETADSDVQQLKETQEQYDRGMDPDHHAYFGLTAWYGPVSVTQVYQKRHFLIGYNCHSWSCVNTGFISDQEEAARNDYPIHHVTMTYSCLPLGGSARIDYNCVVFADDPVHIYYYDKATATYVANYNLRYKRFNIAKDQTSISFGQKPQDAFSQGNFEVPNRVLDYQGLQTFAPPWSKTLDLLKKYFEN